MKSSPISYCQQGALISIGGGFAEDWSSVANAEQNLTLGEWAEGNPRLFLLFPGTPYGKIHVHVGTRSVLFLVVGLMY